MRSGQFYDMSRSYSSEESGEVISQAQVVAIHDRELIIHEHMTSLAVRQSPEHDILAEWATSGLNMTMAITRDIAKPATVVDVDHPSGSLDSRFFSVEPAELFHDNSFWSRTRLRFFADWSVSSPMDLGKTLALAIAKADTISILEYFVK